MQIFSQMISTFLILECARAAPGKQRASVDLIHAGRSKHRPMYYAIISQMISTCLILECARDAQGKQRASLDLILACRSKTRPRNYATISQIISTCLILECARSAQGKQSKSLYLLRAFLAQRVRSELWAYSYALLAYFYEFYGLLTRASTFIRSEREARRT